MCEPIGYTVNYEINPYMKASVVDPVKALRQWRSVKDALLDGGAYVSVVPGHPDYPDMVFAANAAQVVKGFHFTAAIMANFRSEHRAGEAKLWLDRIPGIDLLSQFNARKQPNPYAPHFEGQGDVVNFPGTLDVRLGQPLTHYIIGYGQRTSGDGARQVGNWLETFSTTQKVTLVQLESPYFYHLDTCVFAGSKASVVIIDAIARSSQEALLLHLNFEQHDKPIIYVTVEEGKTLCCNMVETEPGTVVAGLLPSRVRKELEGVGYKVIEVDTSEFLKAGGSVRCMTLDL